LLDINPEVHLVHCDAASLRMLYLLSKWAKQHIRAFIRMNLSHTKRWIIDMSNPESIKRLRDLVDVRRVESIRFVNVHLYRLSSSSSILDDVKSLVEVQLDKPRGLVEIVLEAILMRKYPLRSLNCGIRDLMNPAFQLAHLKTSLMRLKLWDTTSHVREISEWIAECHGLVDLECCAQYIGHQDDAIAVLSGLTRLTRLVVDGSDGHVFNFAPSDSKIRSNPPTADLRIASNIPPPFPFAHLAATLKHLEWYESTTPKMLLDVGCMTQLTYLSLHVLRNPMEYTPILVLPPQLLTLNLKETRSLMKLSPISSSTLGNLTCYTHQLRGSGCLGGVTVLHLMGRGEKVGRTLLKYFPRLKMLTMSSLFVYVHLLPESTQEVILESASTLEYAPKKHFLGDATKIQIRVARSSSNMVDWPGPEERIIMYDQW
jgi:hypothetical protein